MLFEYFAEKRIDRRYGIDLVTPKLDPIRLVLIAWIDLDDIAAHASPTTLREGVLHVSAESTAWATQLRMMQAQILAKIAAAVGHGVVKELRITGPTAPSWRKGERHIRGRGPRDTYG